MTEFATKLREIREQRNLSGSQFAKILGIAQTTYSSYETGKVEPTISTVAKIATVLNVSSDILLGIGKTSQMPGITQMTTNGHNINGNSNVVNTMPGADADEVASLKAEIQALKNKLDYATELIAKLTK